MGMHSYFGVLGSCVLALAACGDDDGPSGPGSTLDAAAIVDAVRFKDAAYQCTPAAPPPPGPACLALDPSTLTGTTPLGTLDVDLVRFLAGDCVTISHAYIIWTGACGELARLHFSYPVTSDATGKRFVPAGSFDTDASFELEPPGAAMVKDLTTIHVDVTKWQEGDGVHDIDITVTFTDESYSVPPHHVQGTFCDWPYYLC
jgi:hypothetical protein